MGTTLNGKFETRREAEMAVERLVQEYRIERTDVFVAATGAENTAGQDVAGSDKQAREPGGGDRTDAALNGAVEVSVDIEDGTLAGKVRNAFAEFSAQDVKER